MLRTQADTLGSTGDFATAARSRTLLRVSSIVGAAVLAATVEVAVARALPPDVPKPHLALVLVASLAVVGGLDTAVLAAFGGGTALDLLAFRPLAGTAFALLLAGGTIAAVASPFTGRRRLAAVAAVIPVVFASGLIAVVRSPPELGAVDPFSRLLAGAAGDAVLALALVVVGLTVRRRRSKEAAPSR